MIVSLEHPLFASPHFCPPRLFNKQQAFIPRRSSRARGKRCFGDLLLAGQEREPPTSPFRYRLLVIASDITNGRMLRLPQDLAFYGQDPDELDIALAVRMSASIPFFYQPILRHDCAGRPYRVVDGGLLSNFPIGIFDVARAPAYPTLGFRLIDAPPARHIQPHAQENLLQFGQELLNTMLNAHDRLYLDEHTSVRTIAIPVDGISGIQFDLSRAPIEQLYRNGEGAAERFFANWNFSAYKAAHRAT